MKQFISAIMILSMLLGLSACQATEDPLDEPIKLYEGGVSIGGTEDSYTPSVTLNDIQEKDKEEKTEETKENESTPEKDAPQSSGDLTTSFVGSADPEVIEERIETTYGNLSAADKQRINYQFGACRQLKGSVGVVVFYLDDAESKWTQDEIDQFTENELQPALSFLKREAAARQIELNPEIKKIHSGILYEAEVITSVEETGMASVSVMTRMARNLDYSNDRAMYQGFKNQFGCDEILCISVFNKGGSSYALPGQRPKETEYEEQCILFAKEHGTDARPKDGTLAAPIAHEILRLYGAEVLYSSVPRKTLAKLHFTGDIMLSTHVNVNTNSITDATAFYIGWLDTPPEPLSHEDWKVE